ncbi:MAG: RNA polymerase sigma factor [Huintestinicola sp.]|uniref:RNA polymerase sigma factor n=1 Tax=Huintestinicola sp. TaxID=2981661 RepID=UPI003F0052EA
MNDTQIIRLYQSRDEKAIEESDKKYGFYCFAVADNILSSREDSEECVSDTWLRSWRIIPPKCPEVLKMFFAKITRSLAIDVIRRKKAVKRGAGQLCEVLGELEECISGRETVESELDRKLLCQCVNRFLSELPQRERNYFLRRYFFAETVKDIAKRYKVSENLVSVTLHRTRGRLKDSLTKEGFFYDGV